MAEKFPQTQRLLRPYDTIHRNIPEVIDRLGLTAEKERCAQSCLHNLTPSDFSREIVQATTRAWYAQDLTALNGLAALVAMNPAVTDSIRPGSGGTSLLIDRLIKLSDVDLRLDSTVTRIQRSKQRNYRLTIQADGRKDQSPSIEEADYDAMIIAAPLQSAGIDFDIGIHLANALNPYVERHVTHFTSADPGNLSPAFFNVSSSDEIPDKILTTTSRGGSDPGFFSIESLPASLGLDGCIAESENMYKVVSAAQIDDATVFKLLGKPTNSTLEGIGVQWVHRQVWHQAFPEHSNNVMLNNIEIAEGIYTGTGEEIVSSLKMSCRMGRLAALLFH